MAIKDCKWKPENHLGSQMGRFNQTEGYIMWQARFLFFFFLFCHFANGWKSFWNVLCNMLVTMTGHFLLVKLGACKEHQKVCPSQEYQMNFTHVQLWRMCNHLKSNEVEHNTITRLRWSPCRQSSSHRGWSGDYEELSVCFSLEVSWTDSMKNEQFRWTKHARCFGAVDREARLRWFAI